MIRRKRRIGSRASSLGLAISNILLLQAECARPSPVLEMALFYDAGTVAARRQDLRSGHEDD